MNCRTGYQSKIQPTDMGPGQQTIALDYFEWGGEALGCRLNGQKQIVLFKPCKLTKYCPDKIS